MPEVLEPPSTFTPHFTDPENARQAGLRSAELAKLKAQELENLRLIFATKPIETIDPKQPVDQEVQHQLDLANELIAHAHARINDKDDHYCEECERGGIDDKSKASLIREIRGLMEHICRLKNIAQAPTSKLSAPRTQPRRAMPEPAEPQPVVVQTDKPSTPDASH